MVNELTDLSKEEVIYIWVGRNRGVCAKIARDFLVTGGFVRNVLYGHPGVKSNGLRIEKALAEAGAPFMASRLEGK